MVVHQGSDSSVSADTVRTRTDLFAVDRPCVPWLGSIIRMRVISRLRKVRELIFVLPPADELAPSAATFPERLDKTVHGRYDASDEKKARC